MLTALIYTITQAFLEQLLDAYVAQDDSWPFREPVPVTIAPDYYDVIKVLMRDTCLSG